MSIYSLNPDSCPVIPDNSSMSSNYFNSSLMTPGCDLSEAYHFQAEVLRTGWILGSLIAYQVRDSIGKGLLDNFWQYHPLLGSLQNSFNTLSNRVTRLAHCSSDPVFSAVQRSLSSLRESLKKEEVPTDLRTQLGLDAEALGTFSDTPLIVSDNGPALPNVISLKEFEYLQKVYRAIEEGVGPLTIGTYESPEFRKLILSDLRVILSTETGRALIYALHDKNVPLTVVQSEENCYYSLRNNKSNGLFETPSPDSHSYCDINPEEGILEISTSEEGSISYFGSPDADKVRVPKTRYTVVFHELTHAYHDLVTGDSLLYKQQDDHETNPWSHGEEKRTILKTNEFRRQLKWGEKNWFGRWGHKVESSFTDTGQKLHALFGHRVRLHDQLNTSGSQEVYNGQSISEFPFCPNINRDLELASLVRSKNWARAILNSNRALEIPPAILGTSLELATSVPPSVTDRLKVLTKIVNEEPVTLEETQPKNDAGFMQVLLNSDGAEGIPLEALAAAFNKVCLDGDLRALQIFISSKIFKKIPTEVLTDALKMLVRFQNLSAAKLFIDSERFGDIPPEALRDIFREAILNIRSGLAQILINSNRFGEIPATDLGNALKSAVLFGITNLVRLLLNSERALEIPSEILGEIFKQASLLGHSNIAKIFFDSKILRQIPLETFTDTFKEASLHGGSDFIQMFMNSERFKEIPLEAFTDAFKEASLYGNSNIIQMFINSERFGEIPPEVFTNALKRASSRGHSDITQMLVSRLSWADTIKYYLGRM